MLTPFSFREETSPLIEGWMVPSLMSMTIGLVSDFLNFPHNTRAVKIPLIDLRDDLKSMPKLSADDCTFNNMGDVLDMSDEDMQLIPLNGEWRFCPQKFRHTAYAHYFKGGGVEEGDMTNSEIGMFIIDRVNTAISNSANTLSFWGSKTATATDYKTEYNGFWPTILAASATSPTGKQAKRITITQNTQISAGVALQKLQALIYGQNQHLRAVPVSDKSIIVNTEFYDALRTDLIEATKNSNAYPINFLNGMEFFTYQGINVFLDPAITQHAQATGFASINATNNFVYLAVLVHNRNFVVGTSINEGDAFDAYYSKDLNKTVVRTAFNYGTYLRDGRFAVIMA